MISRTLMLCLGVLVPFLVTCETVQAQEEIWRMEYQPFKTVGGIDTQIVGILKDGDLFLTHYTDEANGIRSLQLRDYGTGNIVRTILSHSNSDPKMNWVETRFHQAQDRIMIKWQTLESTDGGSGIRYTDQYHYSFLDARSGKQISKWSLRCSPNDSVVSGDGKLFAVATGESGQSTLAIYRIDTGQRIQTIPPIDPQNNWDMSGPFMLSHTGDRLLISEPYPDRPATHHIFDVASKKEQRSWTEKFRVQLPHQSWLSPVGDSVILGNKLFDSATGKVRYSFAGSFLQFTEDSKSIVTLSNPDGAWHILFLDSITGKEMKRINLPITFVGEPNVQASPCFRRYLVLGGQPKSQSGSPDIAIIIDLNSGKINDCGQTHIVEIAHDGKSYIQKTRTHYIRKNVSR